MTRSKILISAVIILSVTTFAIWMATEAQPQADSFTPTSPTPVASPSATPELTNFEGRLEKSTGKYTKVAPYLLKGAAFSTLVAPATEAATAQLDSFVDTQKLITIMGYEKAEQGYVVISTYSAAE